MSKTSDKIKEEIMRKIKKGDIKMKPKLYFIFGYILTLLGLVLSFTSSIFFVGLIRFSLRMSGKMAQYKLDQMIDNFPWWIPVFAIMGLFLGVFFIRKYDFSYKINFKILLAGLVLFIIFSGLLMDMSGLNEKWLYKKHGRGFRQNIDFLNNQL